MLFGVKGGFGGLDVTRVLVRLRARLGQHHLGSRKGDAVSVAGDADEWPPDAARVTVSAVPVASRTCRAAWVWAASNLGVISGDLLGQLPLRRRGRLTNATGLALGGLPCRDPRPPPLPAPLAPSAQSLVGTCLGGNCTRLGAVPGGLSRSRITTACKRRRPAPSRIRPVPATTCPEPGTSAGFHRYQARRLSARPATLPSDAAGYPRAATHTPGAGTHAADASQP